MVVFIFTSLAVMLDSTVCLVMVLDLFKDKFALAFDSFVLS
ncbi:hypothetical protein [Campylobacter californiensis]